MTAEIKGLDFTAQGEVQITTEPVPTGSEDLNLDEEARNVFFMPDGKGVEYLLDHATLARITSWDDKGVLRLAVAERKDGNWPVYREPTIEEMVRFLRVVSWKVGDRPVTNVLRAQVEARLIGQAKAAQHRISSLYTLVHTLYQQKPSRTGA